MMIRAILKQARRYYDDAALQICHVQFYTVKKGALMPAGNCMHKSAFLFGISVVLIHLRGKQKIIFQAVGR